MEQVRAAEPDAFAAWLEDPKQPPHGGESLCELILRVCGWLAACTAGDGRILAVTHAAIIRAAVVPALGAPPVAFWRIDVAPLTFTRLNGQTGRLTLAASNLSSIS